jgi:hypothetical protein
LVLVLAQRTRCVRAPFAWSALKRGVAKIALYFWYVSRPFAIAAFPSSPSSRARSGPVAPAWIRFWISPSASVSMRLMKKEATLATRETSPPEAANASRPSMYASATFSYASWAKSRVMLTLSPSAVAWRMAGMPSGVAGILMKTLGRAARRLRRRASLSVPSVSRARYGDTSRLTKPSAPWVSSNTGRRTSAASWMSRTASASKIPWASRSPWSRRPRSAAA